MQGQNPLNVSKMLFEMGFDARIIAAALLHDTVEDTGISLDDEIIGYITRGKGITVHRINCKNLKSIKDYSKRKIVVEWESKTRKVFNVDIVSRDRTGLLMDITTAIVNSNANIVELYLKANRDGLVKTAFRIQIQQKQQLKMFLKDVKSIPEVISIDYY